MLVRHIARPMLGSIFIVAGADGLARPSASVAATEPLVSSLLEHTPESAADTCPVTRRPTYESTAPRSWPPVWRWQAESYRGSRHGCSPALWYPRR
ncbi:hypothetical protein I540_5663 [Mycobacteroides abscessus subsp. bolletii 1513]|uniref:Uncharacterized protein n=1 Tax=Mycobacteroides abscessus subsp. bolletii 1513 TaxID=1299321 RepID=X8DD90_9MYCO|nr:hypothetical protein I540_5663 [Mycobacteroides abscessus subsp. bolletii 1513]